MFSCKDLANKNITTANILDCAPSSNLTMTADEFAKLANASSSNTLTVAELFTVPAVPDLQTVFMQGFSLPLTLYLVAWAFGVVVNFINER